MNPEYPDSEGCYIARLERTMRDIPDKYHEFLWEYTGSGKSPHAVQAAVEYVESGVTLDEAAESFGTSTVTIRSAVWAMIDAGVVTLEKVQENCRQNGLQIFGEERYLGEDEGETYDHAEITRILSELGITPSELARRIDVTPGAVHEWEDPDSYSPSPRHANRIRELINE